MHITKPFSSVVVLDRGNDTNCTVNLYGGTITSWRVKNHEQLFVSKLTVFDNKDIIRGGIGLIFPKFGPWDIGLKHGFARVTLWKLHQPPELLPNRDIEAIFILKDNAYTQSVWSFKFELECVVTLGEKTLKTKFIVRNNSQLESITFNFYLQTYIRVPDIELCEMQGIKDCAYINHLKDDVVNTEHRNCVKLKHTTDRHYLDCPDELTIGHVTTGNQMKLRKKNLSSIIVWNTWKHNNFLVRYYEPDEYKLVLSIGATCISDITLKPQNTHEYEQILQVIEEDDDDFILDLSNPQICAPEEDLC